MEYVAHLARLDCTEEEKEKFTVQLDEILTYMDVLNAVDTSGLEPMSHAISMTNALRDDAVKGQLGTEAALENAPDRWEHYFRVSKVIE